MTIIIRPRRIRLHTLNLIFPVREMASNQSQALILLSSPCKHGLNLWSSVLLLWHLVVVLTICTGFCIDQSFPREAYASYCTWYWLSIFHSNSISFFTIKKKSPRRLCLNHRRSGFYEVALAVFEGIHSPCHPLGNFNELHSDNSARCDGSKVRKIAAMLQMYGDESHQHTSEQQ